MLAIAFRLAAQVVSHGHSALGAFYRRLRSLIGAPKTVTAMVYKIARLFYYKLWSNEGNYADTGEGFEVVPHFPLSNVFLEGS